MKTFLIIKILITYNNRFLEFTIFIMRINRIRAAMQLKPKKRPINKYCENILAKFCQISCNIHVKNDKHLTLKNDNSGNVLSQNFDFFVKRY